MQNYPRNTNPQRGGNAFGTRYNYQTLPYGYEQGVQAGGLISKVMGLLAFSFLFATIGTFVGMQIGLGTEPNWIIRLLPFIGAIIALIALNILIAVQGLNLLLLYTFTFLMGMVIAPTISFYLRWNADILMQAFLITTVTSLMLSIYAWTTKRDFSRLGDYLFVGLIILLAAVLINFLFPMPLLVLIIAIAGIGIFSAYLLYYVQRAKYLADTMPNAIGMTADLFLTILNLFQYILLLLSILQGGDRD